MLFTRNKRDPSIRRFHPLILIEDQQLTTRKGGDPCPPRLLFFAKTSSLLFFLIMLACSKNCQYFDLKYSRRCSYRQWSSKAHSHRTKANIFCDVGFFFYRFPFRTVWMALNSSLLNLDRFIFGFLHRVYEVFNGLHSDTQHSVKQWRCQLPYSFCPVSSPRPSSFYW